MRRRKPLEVHGCTNRKGDIFRSPDRGRFIGDLVHFAHRIPSAPVSRLFDVTALAEPRVRHSARPSWSCLFMKAYALVGKENPPLRRSLLEFPWPRLYEHPWMNCSLAIERTYQGEEGVFVGIFRAPEHQSLTQLQQAVSWYKNESLEKVGFYRMALRFSHAPTPVRRLLWWSTLNVSGYKRCKRFGTFGLSSYGALGAEQIHPISPLTTTLTYGPIDPMHRPRRRQADLRPPRARRRLHRTQTSRHRRSHERPHPGRAPGRPSQRITGRFHRTARSTSSLF